MGNFQREPGVDRVFGQGPGFRKRTLLLPPVGRALWYIYCVVEHGGYRGVREKLFCVLGLGILFALNQAGCGGKGCFCCNYTILHGIRDWECGMIIFLLISILPPLHFDLALSAWSSRMPDAPVGTSTSALALFTFDTSRLGNIYVGTSPCPGTDPRPDKITTVCRGSFPA